MEVVLQVDGKGLIKNCSFMSIQKNKNEDDRVFGIVERFIALFLILIPLILFLSDDECWRPSISNYVYMDNSYVFGLLLTMAAMLFIFNGALYFGSSEYKGLKGKANNKWYNIILGISLLFVILFPHEEYKYPHYIAAGVFFLGSSLAIALDCRKKNRKWNLFFAILSIVSLVFYFVNYCFDLNINWYTLLVAEWISLTVISIHYYLDSREKVSRLEKRILL